jgi:hypothetical protein
MYLDFTKSSKTERFSTSETPKIAGLVYVFSSPIRAITDANLSILSQ